MMSVLKSAVVCPRFLITSLLFFQNVISFLLEMGTSRAFISFKSESIIEHAATWNCMVRVTR
jgi:hypothetical protein